MHDALLVYRVERGGHLARDGQHLGNRQRTCDQPLGQRFALDELHHEEGDSTGFVEVVHACDVGMAEHREDARFALEALDVIRVEQVRVKDLHRDVPTQAAVVCAIDLAHPAAAEWLEDFVGAQPAAARDRHRSGAVTNLGTLGRC